MSRSVTVRIRSARGTDVVDLDASVLATETAIIDMARQRAGVSPGEFLSGKVVV